MATSRFTLMAASLLCCIVCIQSPARSATSDADPRATAPKPSSSAGSEGASTKPSAGTSTSPSAAPSPLKPLAEGRLIRMTKLGVPPMEIKVPAGFKLKMEGGEELAPTAHLEKADLNISVNQPEGGFSTMESQLKTFKRSYPDSTSIRAEKTDDGYVLVDRVPFAGQIRYTAYVAFPRLKVECSASDLDKLEKAELVASICLTLRSATPRGER